MEKMMNNKVAVSGVVVSAPVFSHEVLGEKFYRMVVEVVRQSEVGDKIPVMVSERLWKVDTLQQRTYVRVEGQFRSYNIVAEDKRRLVLHVLAKEIYVERDQEYAYFRNHIELNGFLCKPPVYRTTPLGREVCDVLLAVNRGYGKSDYIPCIFWGRNAQYVADMQVGDQLRLDGRIQSREYQKRYEDAVETRIAYEVSVSTFEVVTEKEAEPIWVPESKSELEKVA